MNERMKKYCLTLTFVLLIILVFSIYSVNFYFLSRLSNHKSKINYAENLDNEHNEQFNDDQIKIKPIYRTRNPKYSLIRDKIIRNFTPCNRDKNYSQIWDEVDNWSRETSNEIFPQYSPLMCQALKAIREVPIIFAQNARRGTQLKLSLTVEGNKTIYYKPAWYSRSEVVEGEVYAGKDRHNSEILAFYLGAVLNLRWTSIAVGRWINIREIFDVADKDLRETIISKNNGTKLCVYGKCFYCKPAEAVCGNKNFNIEGAFLYEIPGKFTKHKSPWQRTYNSQKKALWELEENNNDYCDNVKRTLHLERLLDLIDASIFDFILQNGDRHHYEQRNNRLLLIDNGKGFGNPFYDFMDILAPLYQCCLMRKKTYARLLIFTGGTLSEILKELTKNDFLYPIITDKHFFAIERRLLKIFTVIEFCKGKYGNSIFH